MNITQRFIDALHTLEADGDEHPIAQLFATGAKAENPLVSDAPGDAPAAAFWRSYRGAFDSIRSEFRNVVRGDGVSILEWTSDGSRAGESVRYGGTSVVEHDGTCITAFRSYFDPAKIGLTKAHADAD